MCAANLGSYNSPTQYAHDEGGRFWLRNTRVHLLQVNITQRHDAVRSRSTAQTARIKPIKTTFHQRKQTAHCPAHTHTALPVSHCHTLPLFLTTSISRLHSTKVFFFSQPTAYPKNSLSFITSTCTAQSLQRVLPILHNHFNVYPFYSTATSCTASFVQSLQRVLPLLHNHFVYSLYCTIT